MKELIDIPDNIKCLISGHLTGSLNADDLNILKKWITKSPDNKNHFNEMRYAWISSGDSSCKQGSGRSMLELMNEIQLSGNKKTRPISSWMKIAAS